MPMANLFWKTYLQPSPPVPDVYEKYKYSVRAFIIWLRRYDFYPLFKPANLNELRANLSKNNLIIMVDETSGHELGAATIAIQFDQRERR